MRRIDADHLKETLDNLVCESDNKVIERNTNQVLHDLMPQVIADEPTVGQSHEEFAAKLTEKINDKYWEAVDDAQGYYNPNVAQDALENAYNNVLSWINEILIEFLQENKDETDQ